MPNSTELTPEEIEQREDKLRINIVTYFKRWELIL